MTTGTQLEDDAFVEVMKMAKDIDGVKMSYRSEKPGFLNSIATTVGEAFLTVGYAIYDLGCDVVEHDNR